VKENRRRQQQQQQELRPSGRRTAVFDVPREHEDRNGEDAHDLLDRLEPVTFESLSIPVTMSIGAAAWEAPMTRSSLLAAADEALYQAKALGRNRTELFPITPSAQID
jgi:GGDEF domain-containing protein